MEPYRIEMLHKSDPDVGVQSASVFSYHVHMHSFYEMTLYEPFDGAVTVNDKTFPIDTRTAVLVVPSDFHRIEVNGDATARFIKISFSNDLLPDGVTPQASLILGGIDDGAFLIRLFEEILTYKYHRAYKRALVSAAVCGMVERGEAILPAANSSGHKLATRAVGLINENFAEHITLTSVAEALSVAPQYLSQVFAENIGINFSRFLTEVRLRRASKLLLETEESVTRICDLCGYRDLSHFLRSFKKEFGVSPSAYRSKMK